MMVLLVRIRDLFFGDGVGGERVVFLGLRMLRLDGIGWGRNWYRRCVWRRGC